MFTVLHNMIRQIYLNYFMLVAIRRVNALVTSQSNVFMITELEQLRRTKRETESPSPVDSRTVHFVPVDVPFYLSCPIDSYHANYYWEHGDQKSPCLQMQSNCLHLIPIMTQESYGDYKCVSEEKNYTRLVKYYALKEQKIYTQGRNNNTGNRNPTPQENAALAVVGQTWINLGLVLAAMGIGI